MLGQNDRAHDGPMVGNRGGGAMRMRRLLSPAFNPVEIAEEIDE